MSEISTHRSGKNGTEKRPVAQFLNGASIPKRVIIASDWEGLGIGLGLGIRIADLNHIADLKLSILAPVKFRSPI